MLNRTLNTALLPAVPLLLSILLPALGTPPAAQILAPPTDPVRELELLLRHPAARARVLYVTAHPDDEDAGLLAWLRYGEGVETTLMTLTRGEGGQNEIGQELHVALGVLRSRELQAAGRYTGAAQFFSSAVDFGYSFSVEETLDRWNAARILQQIVTVIRRVQPDIVLTLPHEGEGGGQHHQASARLALKACTLAADPGYTAAPGPPVTVQRLFRVLWGDGEEADNLCAIDLSEYDPILGASFNEIGLGSRAQHKCQGMARLYDPHPERVSRWEFLWSSNPKNDPPRPVETFWEGLTLPPLPWEGISLTQEMLRPQDVLRLSLELWKALPQETRNIHTAIARRRATRAVELASGIDFIARAERALVPPGAPLAVELAMRPVHGATLHVTLEGPLISPRAPEAASRPVILGTGADTNSAPLRKTITVTTASTLDPLHATGGIEPSWTQLFARPMLALRGLEIPLTPRPVLVQELDPAFPAIRWASPMAVPDPAVRFQERILPFVALNQTVPRTTVELLVSTLAPASVDVSLETPAGENLRITPAVLHVQTPGNGTEVPARFTVTGSLENNTAHQQSTTLQATAVPADKALRSSTGYQRIAYPHIQPAVFLEPAQATLIPIALTLPQDLRVGYVMGTGDRIPEALEAMGVHVVLLDREALEGDLDAFDTIITGVRAYKVREDLKAAAANFRRWMETGGHLVVMYNKMEFNAGQDTSPYAPFEGCSITHDRVTDETAPVTALLPEHPLLHAPNTIGPKDWEGWVQERGLYFLNTSNETYQSLLALQDPFPYNRGIKTGALVWAPVGKGSWTYVGLGLFRELPQGVPGAYRLLANLLSQGRTE